MDKWDAFKAKFAARDKSIVNTILVLSQENESGETTVHIPWGCYQVRLPSTRNGCFGLEALSDDFKVYLLQPEMIDCFRLATSTDVISEQEQVLARMELMLRFKRRSYQQESSRLQSLEMP